MTNTPALRVPVRVRIGDGPKHEVGTVEVDAEQTEREQRRAPRDRAVRQPRSDR